VARRVRNVHEAPTGQGKRQHLKTLGTEHLFRRARGRAQKIARRMPTRSD